MRHWVDVLEEIRSRLAQLAPATRAAFAVACAERLVRAHERLPEDEQGYMTLKCRDLIDAMWSRLGLPLDARPASDAALSQVEAGADNADEDDAADNAHLATLKAARCVGSGDVADAVWAASHVIEAALEAAEIALELDENGFAWDPAADPPMPAARYEMHAHVRAAVARLLADLDRLERDGVGPGTLTALRR